MKAPASSSALLQQADAPPSSTRFESVTESPSTESSVQEGAAPAAVANVSVVGEALAPASRKPACRFVGSTSGEDRAIEDAESKMPRTDEFVAATATAAGSVAHDQVMAQVASAAPATPTLTRSDVADASGGGTGASGGRKSVKISLAGSARA